MQIMEIKMRTKQELLAQIAELQAKVEAMPDDQPTGRVIGIAHKEETFVVWADGSVSENLLDSHHKCVKQGKVFYDKQPALDFARYEQLTQEMRVITAKYEPCDWQNKGTKKYFICYSFHTSEWCEEYFSGHKNIGAIYCSKSGALLEWVNSLSASDQEILKWGEL
jgi:hypothetical protein